MRCLKQKVVFVLTFEHNLPFNLLSQSIKNSDLKTGRKMPSS